jgi:recombination associated protein RdgC
MFKNLILYRIAPEWQPPPVVPLDAELARGAFVPCGASQPMSIGWVPPRGQAHATFVETVGGGQHWLLRLMVERKLLPSSVVKRRVDEMAAQIEQSTGRQPGKKQRGELKDQATLELLPMAFTKQSALQIWMDLPQRLLCVDAGSAKAADEVLSLLVRSLDGLALAPLHTAQSPAQVMADWLLSGEPPSSFTVDRECELKSPDEMKSVVRYARHPLDTDEVRAHITQGKRPTRLALTWAGRVSFVLTETGQLKKLDFLDGVFEGQGSAQGEDQFDADAAITTGELGRLLPDLIDALGGEQLPGMPAPDPGASPGAASRDTALPVLADDGPPF